ncbi:hypothetical protein CHINAEXTREME_18255 [Halobiforma lacisalsi AJ5]|uniref:DUF7847 domain-containing protein n=1 Tax=Natronobacterium lacisalsi AJ5 TaxID=358396 RepID=M0LRA2_NATLA|nr:hypothetical protein [Halobiforma haloterrestris]APW99592.1 hypothetical protein CHINAEXTREME_18255 [Halobiforma lacisalsi AJ5]EMA35623.1 hypothetical protein C445_05313 [Halobiforma lacisalsi AJ5]
MGALLFTLFSESYVLLDAYAGPIAQLLSVPVSIFVTPFFLGGFITMVDEGLEGSTRLGSFVRGGKENYVSLLGATILFFAIFTGLGFGGLLLMAFIGIGTAAAGGGGGGFLVAGILLLGLFAVVLLCLQFYDAAIVVSDASAFDSFLQSISLVRRNFLGVVGFSIVFVVISLLGQGPGMVLYTMALEFTETGETMVASESTLLLSAAATVVFGTLGLAYAYTYFVAYYRSLIERGQTAAA